MRKLLAIGIMLLIQGCNPPTIEKPIESIFINFDLGATQSGPVSFDYKKKNVGKWSDGALVSYGDVSELQGTYYCMSAESFFTKVTPKLIEGHDYWVDSRKFRD